MVAPLWWPVVRRPVCPPPPLWTSRGSGPHIRPQDHSSWITDIRLRARLRVSPRPQTRPRPHGGRGLVTPSQLLVQNKHCQDSHCSQDTPGKHLAQVKTVVKKPNSRSKLLTRLQLNRGHAIEAHHCEVRGSWATMVDRERTAPAIQKKVRQRMSLGVEWAEVRLGDTHSGCRDHPMDTRPRSLNRPGPLADLPSPPCPRVIRVGEERGSMFRATG